MQKKLSLTDLSIKSFVTTEASSIKGGITGNNTGCPTNHTCAYSQQKGCGASEFGPACDPKTKDIRDCVIEIETIRI